MNRLFRSLKKAGCLLLVATLLTSCETGFEEINTNPTNANQIPPEFLFPTIVLGTAFTQYEAWRSNLIYPSAMIQHLSNMGWSGDKYMVAGNQDHITALWLVAYNGAGDPKRAYIKLVQDLIHSHKDEPRAVNKVAAARIMRVLAFHRVTDMYGDIPYSEAGMGYLGNNVQPKFDPQSEIYADMLKELDEAAKSFDPSMPTFGNADIIYKGDLTKWKKFAYSLMLRLGMRMSKVDPAKSQEWVQKAIAGGVMTSNADIAYVQHQDGPSGSSNGLNTNAVSEVFLLDNAYLSEFLVDWMQATEDPRLRIFAAKYDGFVSKAASQILSDDPKDQAGYPVGNDGTTIQGHRNWVEAKGMLSFSQPHRLILGLDDPTFFITYAEVELMLAEAAVRGWHAGDPATHYANGVRAAMKHLALYDGAGRTAISDAQVDEYLAKNPYDPARGLEMIGTQYWVANFLNGNEAWANWRRTGYPRLAEVNYPGNAANGRIPRRMTYPSSEAILNPDNYQAAVARQGPDLFTTRMWWDIEQ